MQVMSARLELEVHPGTPLRGLDPIPVPLGLDRTRVLAHADERVADVWALSQSNPEQNYAPPHGPKPLDGQRCAYADDARDMPMMGASVSIGPLTSLIHTHLAPAGSLPNLIPLDHQRRVCSGRWSDAAMAEPTCRSIDRRGSRATYYVEVGPFDMHSD